MALWGNTDSVYSDGTIAVNLETNEIFGVSGFVTFTTAGISTGDVVTVGAGATYGYAVVTGFTSTTISIASSEHFATGVTTVPAGVTYNVSQEPVYVLKDSHYRAPESKTVGFSTSPVFTGVFGVDSVELGVANAASGEGRKYAVPHTGWVGITTYVDCHGTIRVKSEVLVAGGILTTSDAADNTQFPNS